MQTAAELGSFHFFKESRDEMLAELYKRDASGNTDAIFDQISKNAPDLKQAEAKLNEAQANLDQAKLNLSYCDIAAPPLDCSLCCPTKAAAWELRSLKLFRNGASSFIPCG